MLSYRELKQEIVLQVFENLEANYYLLDSAKAVNKELWKMLGTIKVPNKSKINDVVYHYIVNLENYFLDRYPSMLHT